MSTTTKRKPGPKVGSHRNQPTENAGSQTTQAPPPANKQSRIPTPRSIPPGSLLNDMLRFEGIISECRRQLAIAEANYERHLGRICQSLNLDANWRWEFHAGSMVPTEFETLSSAGLAMAAGAGTQGSTTSATGD